jgi:hypothetical protein
MTEDNDTYRWTSKGRWPTPVQCKEEAKKRQKFKGTFSDAICNGVHATPLHRASENGRLKVVLVLLAQGIVSICSFPRKTQQNTIALDAGNIYITRIKRGPNGIFRMYRCKDITTDMCLMLAVDLHLMPLA